MGLVGEIVRPHELRNNFLNVLEPTICAWIQGRGLSVKPGFSFAWNLLTMVTRGEIHVDTEIGTTLSDWRG